MKQVTSICAAAFLSCALVSAQGQTEQAKTATQPQGRAATSSFIGCVERGSTPNAFVLSVVEIPGAPSSTQVTGTTGTPMVGHRLDLIGGTNLAAHAGHKVELSGMIVPAGTATGRTTGQPAANMKMNVTTVRMIDAMCTAAPAPRATGTSGTSTSDPAPRNQNPQPEPQTPGQRQY